MQVAISIGLLLAILWFLEKMLGTPMIIRPIIVSSLVGIILNDVQSGILMGVTLELVFIGAIQIGASVPPDVLVGAGLGTAFAILSGKGAEIALALALPIAILAQSIKIVIFIYRSSFMSKAKKMAESGNIKGLYLLNLYGLIIQCLMYFFVAFFAILFGSEVVAEFIKVIPQPLLRGLGVAAKIIPAVGFALLLQPMLRKGNVMYFLLGFALVAYLNIPILGITLFGLILSYITVFDREIIISEESKVQSKGDDLFDN
ncbi:PTS mannose/fructose/sorbose/N-acetylgalactosamine transporter subunit IIC [Oceanivirga salmonicida]|uniref:PTS mannose/fructose/sorbose/N-acetylgalactosamine transporter subunit IIC n=1 Tax=Oceanivirga salmonicida TaxID=1769291 RepID=UPI0008375602|nr:PTS sugar transporter subunit IIC [Oceanivirga salmonicida]